MAAVGVSDSHMNQSDTTAATTCVCLCSQSRFSTTLLFSSPALGWWSSCVVSSGSER